MRSKSIVLRLKSSPDSGELDDPAGLMNGWTSNGWSEIVSNYSGVSISSRFYPRFAKFLEETRTNFDNPNRRLVDMSRYLTVVFDNWSDAHPILEKLNEFEAVEIAYLEPVASVASVNPDDPRYQNQGYLKPAPIGVGSESGWPFTGGDGAGQRFVDVELGWTVDHEDLEAHEIELIHGSNHDEWRFHGTAVLGEICAVDNTVGCIGIVPNLDKVAVSSAYGSNPASAIIAAGEYLQEGGVVLIELQWVDLFGYQYVILEAADDVFHAITHLVARGIHVVEAAGNGSIQLDYLEHPAEGRILDRERRSFRDSGAIVVGAASSGVPHNRLWFSNLGSRVDCYGWGHNVNTCYSNNQGDKNLYTETFDGTSAASPIVTGVALSLLGIAENSGTRLSPQLLRALLSDPANGTPSRDPQNDQIGVMPDIRRLISRFGILPDLYIRDNVADVGNRSNGVNSSSPDIIVRNFAVTDPNGEFGQGSGTENDVLLSDDVATGSNNFIYLRARNRGVAYASNVTCDVYWAHPSTLITPRNWNLIGSREFPTIPPGRILMVSDRIVWDRNNIPGPGHYCFIGLLHHSSDPRPNLSHLDEIQQFVHFVNTDNNVAWRNFSAVDMAHPDGTDNHSMPVVVRNTDEQVAMTFEVVTRLPPGSYVAYRMPGDNPIDLPVAGRFAIFSETILPSLIEIKIEVRIPYEYWSVDNYEVYARQTYQGIEVGRVTWMFKKREGLNELGSITD